MTTTDVSALVAQGITAFNAGDRDRAYALLAEALQADPHNEAGWLWMSGVVQEPAERRYCLERVIAINPKHEAAQRGLSKLPADLVTRSPLPTPKPAQPDPARCTYPGCNEPVSRAGHTLCYEHWKQSKQPKAATTPKAPTKSATPTAPTASAALLNASQLGERLELSSQRVNLLLSELGWIERKGPSWFPTAQGQSLGAVKRYHGDSGKAYVVWPESVLGHNALRAAIGSVRGETSLAPAAITSDQSFRKRFPAEHRTTDGHLVRSKAEILIDNWLYMAGVVHAYERRLPIEEEVYCDFYLPAGKVYIEYWGLENDPVYNARRQTKTEIYRRYELKLIELTDEHIRNLDDHLPKMLLKYGIAVE